MNTATLEAHAREAIRQYNADLAAGSEPVFPEWTTDLLQLIASREQLAMGLCEIRSAALRAKQTTMSKVILDMVEASLRDAGVTGKSSCFTPQVNIWKDVK